MPLCVLIRHGESEWNAQNLFTGWRDPGLTEKGKAEARAASVALRAQNYRFDIAFTSSLLRAQDSCALILDGLGQAQIKVIKNKALNERDYGALSGLNKDAARAKWGEEQVHIWRRSYDVPPPAGESLKDTAERVLPYFETMIKPHFANVQNVLIVAHGNSLRALIMQLDGLAAAEIVKVEIGTGQPICYEMDAQGNALNKQTLPID